MTTKIIPERKIVRCDVCTRVLGYGPGEVAHLHNAKLTLKRDALDYQNNACADASLVFDLCDECMKAVADGINAAALRIQHFVGVRPKTQEAP